MVHQLLFWDSVRQVWVVVVPRPSGEVAPGTVEMTVDEFLEHFCDVADGKSTIEVIRR
jgi:hypothetical protein